MSACGNRIRFDETGRQQAEERTRRFFQEKGWETAKIDEILKRRYEHWLRARQRWEEREEMKKESGGLFGDVLVALTRHDIIGIADEHNPDAATEYEPEVGTIVPRLNQAQTAADVERIVKEEFLRWFGESNYLPEPLLQARFRLMADDIWTALYRYRQQNLGSTKNSHY